MAKGNCPDLQIELRIAGQPVDALAKQLRPSTAAPASPAIFVSADDRTEPGARRLRSRPKTAMARTPSQQVRRSTSQGGLVRPHTAVPSSQRKGGKRIDVSRPTTATLRKQLIRDGQWPSGRWKYRHHHHHSHFPKRGTSAKSGSTVSSFDDNDGDIIDDDDQSVSSEEDTYEAAAELKEARRKAALRPMVAGQRKPKKRFEYNSLSTMSVMRSAPMKRE